MRAFMLLFKRTFLLALLSLCLHVCTIYAQQNNQSQTSGAGEQASDDVVRVRTELVQTSVMVFDKQGRFVENLRQEEFELRADDKPVSLSFFDRVLAGSRSEQAQVQTARGEGKPAAAASNTSPLARGRTVIFFIDDLHLSMTSYKTARDMLLNFINNEMGPYDMAAIASGSGKIGFLQQFTDDKMVLRAAVARLSPNQNRSVRDGGYPPMSEDEAMMIDRGDRDMLNFFVDQMLKEGLAMSMSDRRSIEDAVRERARTIVQYSGDVANTTFGSLEQLMRASQQMPGLKVAFFISDGFTMDFNTSSPAQRMQRIADAAGRAGVVVYSIDARGLYTAQKDASEGGMFDPTALSMRSRSNSFKEMQDPLNAVAVSTGGRFIRNTNEMKGAIRNALKETESYYLLAWRPDPETQGGGKFRKLEVSLKGHPDLIVRVQRGYLTESQKPAAKMSKKELKEAAQANTPDGQLRAALASPFPKRDLPTSLSLWFLYPPDKSPNLTANLQVRGEAVEFTPEGSVRKGKVDVVCLIYDEKGKQVGFIKDHLSKTASAESNAQRPSDFFYSYRALLKPGLYQVRMATRDVKSGRIGSAMQWIEIPDMKKGRLAMSSMIVGERATELKAVKLTEAVDAGAEGVSLNVERSFQRTSFLRYVIYVYNASRGASGTVPPNIVLQTHLFLDKTPLMSTPPSKVSIIGQDPLRLAYAAEVPLESLTPGRYLLRVTAIDRNSNTSARQFISFEVK